VQRTVGRLDGWPDTLTTKQLPCYEMLKKASDLGRFFDTTQEMEGYEIWDLEHSNSLRGNALRNTFWILVAEPERKDHLGGLGINMRIILMWTLKCSV
jgi:hypothetical protein